ncbi:DUF5947 family protein [Nocardia sp. alder85J]|uniref:DUF5947 family protein n=1 Tax=Nocardia sp. alder85J TaxID=2862949 RepID=UPI001CD476F8|nr:DUF5947 family protein [Nocardia sp. alder85J]MCX4098104.1 DUF5947 family protein [Nocardia sp. alder85J]
MSTSFTVLRRLAATAAPAAGDRCEMCTEPIGGTHQHVVDLEGRQLMCVCRGCCLLFTDPAAAQRYRAVPDRCLAFPGVTVEPAEWNTLEIPVGLAFFFRNSRLDRTVAVYPGPAGATESELPLENWQAILDRHPEFGTLADDVEALLIRMPERGSDGGCVLLPIDACYEFVGHMRRLWRGFDGGQDAHRYIDEFFTTVTARGRS